MTTSSSAHFSAACLRFTSCFIAVRKPCGLNQPVSQYALGRPVLSHLWSWSWRVMRPTNHDPSVPASQLFLSHAGGMRASKSASSAVTRSPARATVPAMARRRFLSVLDVRLITTLRRSISWRRKTVSGCAGPPGSFLSFSRVSSFSKALGTLARSSSAVLSTTSSRVRPPEPPPLLGIVSMMVVRPFCTWSVRNVRSAFGCKP
mmetsp:Transcript_23991/g.78016  ORF Transcript_23991/g.78016 Transcript_23991/m.78016 type:complete len:204 (+) Transcript_23991:394-1005(+)